MLVCDIGVMEEINKEKTKQEKSKFQTSRHTTEKWPSKQSGTGTETKKSDGTEEKSQKGAFAKHAQPTNL